MKYRLTTLQRHPKLIARYAALVEQSWPLFLYYSEASKKYGTLLTDFKQHQLLLYTNRRQVIAAGNMLPIVWDGTLQGLPTGWDTALAQVGREKERESAPTALLAVSVMVDSQYWGEGLSSIMLKAMCKNAADHGFEHIIAPVRPTRKSRYPFTPMQEYIGWTRENGEHFDPWLRVHARVGGKILQVAPESMEVRGSIVAWETWTGMRFPRSGEYAIPGGLHPVVIECEKNEGYYIEPNVWMLHTTRDKALTEHRSTDQSRWRNILQHAFHM